MKVRTERNHLNLNLTHPSHTRNHQNLTHNTNTNTNSSNNTHYLLNIQSSTLNFHPSNEIMMNMNSLRISIPKKGTLLGPPVIDKNTSISKCYRFLKVPYALPPTGERRWQKPLPLPPAFSYGSANNPTIYNIPSLPCPQISEFMDRDPSTEDCLQSNIYVPMGTPPSDGWPVFMYIRVYHPKTDCMK